MGALASRKGRLKGYESVYDSGVSHLERFSGEENLKWGRNAQEGWRQLLCCQSAKDVAHYMINGVWSVPNGSRSEVQESTST